jgi:hypothetical protein
VASFDAGQLVIVGAARWRAVREALRAAEGPGTGTTPPRLAWAKAYAAVSRCDVGPLGPATAVYLTACLLRHAEMDRYCETLPGPEMEALTCPT